MKITQKFVGRVKRHNSEAYHASPCHAFEARRDVEAVQYALSQQGHGDTQADLVRAAEGYWGAVQGGQGARVHGHGLGAQCP